MMPQCSACGRFCRPDDEYTDFGDSSMLEPPDPVLFCAKCSKAEEERLVRETVRPRRLHLPWRPARFHLRAMKRLGMVLAPEGRFGPLMAFWPDTVPEGYRICEAEQEKGDEHDTDTARNQ